MSDLAIPDDLSIPTFLLVANRDKWKSDAPPLQAKPIRQCRKRARYDLPKHMEPAGWELLKEIEKQERQKKAERLASLREMRARARR